MKKITFLLTLLFITLRGFSQVSTTTTPSDSCNGSATLLNSGSYSTFTWYQQGAAIQNGGSTIYNLCIGNYYVVCQDTAKLDTFNFQITAVQNPCATFNASISKTPTQQGVCNGTMSVSANRTVVSYSWSDTSLYGANVNNVCAGSYQVTVTDSLGCTYTTSTYISTDTSTSDPCPNLQVSLIATDATQSGLCNGALTVSSNRQLTNYSWSDSTFSGANIANVCSGNYAVTVTDVLGCVKSATATVSVNTNPCFQFDVAISSITNQTSPGACNGSVTALVSNGTQPFQYNWGSGMQSTTPNYSGLCDGRYTLKVTDANACMDTIQFDILDDSILSSPCYGVTIGLTTNVTNANSGNCNGSIVVSNFYGNGVAPYEVTWSNGYRKTNLDKLCPGYYGYTVVDANGCSSKNGLVVLGDSSLIYTLVVGINTKDVSTTGACNGSAIVNIAGGKMPYAVSFSNGSTNNWAENLCEGLYTASVTDGNGQISNIDFIISSPNKTFSSAYDSTLKDSVVLASLTTEAIESCALDYNAIDSIIIANYYKKSIDTLAVVWKLFYNNTSTNITQYYGIKENGVYEFVLSLYCGGRSSGNFAKAYSKVFINTTTTSVGAIASSKKSSVYPNPFNSTVNVVLHDEATISVTDLLGKTVKTISEKAGTVSIPTADLPKGIYLVIVNTNGSLEFSKLVKE